MIQINWDEVGQICSAPELSPSAGMLVRECVLGACARWLEEDLNSLELLAVEAEYPLVSPQDSPPLGGNMRGIIDLLFRIRDDPRESAYKPYAGKLMVVDWKSSENCVQGEDWKNRYLFGSQWRLYAAATGADLFAFRGVGQEGSLRSLLIVVPENNTQQALADSRSVFAMSRLLHTLPAPWPRAWPDPCKKFEGCPFLSDCHNGTWPEGIPEETHKLSHSSMGTMLACPEKYRRMQLLKEASADGKSGLLGGRSAVFGSAFHAAMASVYRQAFRLDNGLPKESAS